MNEDLGALLASMSKADRILANAVKEIGLEALEEVMTNLSGKEFSWNGSNFVINVRTGNLRRMTRMEYPFLGNPLSVAVFNRAPYAEAIEKGVSGASMVRALLRKGKVSKAGGRYRVVPMNGSFVTVTEKSLWKDTPGRPFNDAALESIEERVVKILERAVERIFE